MVGSVVILGRSQKTLTLVVREDEDIKVVLVPRLLFSMVR